MKKEKYKIIYKKHGSKVWDTWSVYSYREVIKVKDLMLSSYMYSDIKIFHYDLVKDIGMPKCVFNAVDLIDLYDLKEVA